MKSGLASFKAFQEQNVTNGKGGSMKAYRRFAVIIIIVLLAACAGPQQHANTGPTEGISASYSFHIMEGYYNFKNRNYDNAIAHFNEAYRLAAYSEKGITQECIAIAHGMRGIEYGLSGYLSQGINDIEVAINKSHNPEFRRTLKDVKSLFLIGRSDIKRLNGDYIGAFGDLIDSISK